MDDAAVQPRQNAGAKTAGAEPTAILNALSAYVVVLAPDGAIVTANEAWRRFAREHRLPDGLEASQSLLAVCEGAEADAAARSFAAGIRAVTSGEQDHFLVEFPCHSDDARRWFRTTVTPLAERAPRGVVLMQVDITAQKATEAALRESEARLRAIVETEPECVKLVSLEGAVLEMNLAGRCMLEVDDPRAIIGRPIHPFIHPDDRELFFAHHDAAAAGEVRELRARIVGAKGTERWVESRAVPLRQDDTVTAVLSVTRDVTERVRAEELLRERETMLANAERIADMGSWKLELRDNRLLWSKHTFRIFGVDERTFDATWEGFYELILPEDRARMDASQARALLDPAGVVETEYRVRRPDGEVRWMYERGTIERDASDTPVRRVGVVMDITSRKRTEEALRSSEARFRRVFEDAAIGIAVSTTDGRFVAANPAYCGMLGYTEDELCELDVLAVTHRDDVPSNRELIRKLVTGERDRDYLEKRYVHKDGHEVWARTTVSAQRDGDGRVAALMATAEDVTERKRLEQQLLQAQRLESVGTLASGIAHDLNNALAPILMATSMLKEGERDEERLEDIEAIELSAQRGADMVRQLMLFARGGTITRQPVDVAKVVEELRRILKDTFPKDLEIRIDLPAEPAIVVGDPTQLHQVLMNLCVNARDAMPSGGALSVIVKQEVLDEVFAGMHVGARPGAYVVLRVEDTGAGIPRHLLDRVFDPFFTTKELGKGTGLGLSTTHAIVRNHGGFMNVYSEPGRGTRIKVYLPADAHEPAAAPVADAEAHLPHGRGQMVLLIDDEEAIRAVTRRTLERHGYRVMLASHGAEGVSLYAQHREHIDVVLTDMAMPVMDGPATIVALKSMDPAVRIIGSSGLDANGHVAKAVGAGVQRFVPKPFTAEALLRAIHQVLSDE